MKIKTQLTLAALMAMGLFASGCSQQSADASASPAQQTTQATSQQTTSQQTTSQQTSQQATAEEGEKVVVEPVEPTPAKPIVKEVVRTVVDCSKCGKRPGGRPAGGKWTHSHPAIPGCTKSITHSHPYSNRNHKHNYSCKKAGPKKVVKRPPVKRGGGSGVKRTPRPMGNKWLHSHPAIPGCTNSVTHAHPYTNRNHTHAYGCRPKAKGGKKVVRPPVRRPMPPMVRPVPRPLPPVQVPTIVVPPTKAKGNYKGPIGYNPATLKMMSDYQQAK